MQWISVALRTGRQIAEFPDLDPGSVTHTLGQYDSTTVSFPLTAEPGPPSNWIEATKPLGTMIVGVDAMDASLGGGRPRFGGIVQQRLRPGGGRAQLAIATPESYLTRRFITGTRQYPQTDRVDIAADLLTRYVIDGAGGKSGIPLRIVKVNPGKLVDGDYADTDDRSIYSALQDLGLEWSIDLEWTTDSSGQDCVTMVAYLGDRLGIAAAGSGPGVTLDWPGNLASVSITEDYGDGLGANDVLATSTGQGKVRPQSDHQVDVSDTDLPTVERRFSPGSNITSRATLNSEADDELQALKQGATTYAIGISQLDPAAWAFGIGDDVGIDLAGPEFPENPSSVQRVIGIAIDASNVTPALQGAQIDG